MFLIGSIIGLMTLIHQSNRNVFVIYTFFDFRKGVAQPPPWEPRLCSLVLTRELGLGFEGSYTTAFPMHNVSHFVLSGLLSTMPPKFVHPRLTEFLRAEEHLSTDQTARETFYNSWAAIFCKTTNDVKNLVKKHKYRSGIKCCDVVML